MKLIKTISLLSLSLFATANVSAQTVELVKAEKVKLEAVVASAKNELALSFATLTIVPPAKGLESLLAKQTTGKNEKSVKLVQIAD